MEPSPLTRQLPPEVFQPKVVHLYESLFKVKMSLLVLNRQYLALRWIATNLIPYRRVAPALAYYLELSTV